MGNNRFVSKTLDYEVLDVRFEDGRYEIRPIITDRSDWTRYSPGWVYVSPFDAEYSYEAQQMKRTPDEEVGHVKARIANAAKQKAES